MLYLRVLPAQGSRRQYYCTPVHFESNLDEGREFLSDAISRGQGVEEDDYKTRATA